MSISNGYSAIPEEGEEPVLNTNKPPKFPQRSRNELRNYVSGHKLPAVMITLIVVFTTLLAGMISFLPKSNNSRSSYSPLQPPINIGISPTVFEEGLSKCKLISKDVVENTNRNRVHNPRVPDNTRPVLLRNAVVWDGEGGVLNNVDILMMDGVISDVKRKIQAPESAKIIDVGGNIVSPGIVDMHTHLGVMSWPDLSGTSDTNEKTNPVTPFVRTIDAFNPSDKAIRIVASGGVTTALVLPGSGNLIGGEAFVFKLRPTGTSSSQDMLVQAGIDEATEHKWRYMKMACGENPKSYGNKDMMPSTRLGEAYLFRKSFAEAQKLKQEQEDWCEVAEQFSSFDKDKFHLNKPFPEDLRLESLTALLRGEVKLNIHCYETHDIEALLRHAEEFNFNISSFHHALEAYKIPSILKRARNNITIATFADHWGYKKEAYEASTQAPKLLFEAGIPVALKSDHPVLNSQHMAFEAAKTTHYGLPPQEAFKAITSTPAKALGLDHRIGSLKVGYDADVVIWDRSPLSIGAAPYQVFIDGVPLFEEKPITPAKTIVEKSTSPLPVIGKTKLKNEASKNFILTNIGSNFLKENSSSMIIKDGKILCYNQEVCSKDIDDDNFEIIDAQGGFVLPGMVAVGSKLGMVEIPSEGSTGDGIVPPSYSQNPNSIVEAVDGLKLGTKKLKEAYKGGVLTTISAPISRNIVIGVSAAFKTNADSILGDGALLSSSAAIHFQIGHSVKSERFPTVSSQISFLRQTFKQNLHEFNRYGQAARGEIPIIVMVNNKDEIASLINLKKTIIPNARMAIMGGAEAHLLAPYLANAKIAVVLRPYLCTPENFDSSLCLTGAPLTNGTAAHILHYYGVKLGIGISNDGWARNLAWDAGYLAATPSSRDLAITDTEAIKFVSTNLQEIFGLIPENAETQTKQFVVWSGNPFDMQHAPLFSFDSESGIHLL